MQVLCGRSEYRSKYGWNRAKECGFASVGSASILVLLYLILIICICVCVINSKVVLSELSLILFTLLSSELTWYFVYIFLLAITVFYIKKKVFYSCVSIFILL